MDRDDSLDDGNDVDDDKLIIAVDVDAAALEVSSDFAAEALVDADVGRLTIITVLRPMFTGKKKSKKRTTTKPNDTQHLKHTSICQVNAKQRASKDTDGMECSSSE
jgi:hypothetical protein